MTKDSLLQLKLLDRAGTAAGLSRRDFEAVVGEDKILTGLRIKNISCMERLTF